MKRIIPFILLLVISQSALSQCDEFSKTILQIVKTESYEDFKAFFEPIEAKRIRMQWPEGSEATNYINTLNDALFKALVESAKQLREEHKKQGWDLSKANYVSCQRTSGTSSAIKVNFKIINREESFIIQTYEGEGIYLTKSLVDGKKGFITPIKSYTVINEKQYTTFKPRKDELSKGLLHLKRFLAEQEATDYSHHCTLGLNDLYAGVFLEFLVMQEERDMYVLVDLVSGECQEVFK